MLEDIIQNISAQECKNVLSEDVQCHQAVLAGCGVLSEMGIVAAVLTLTLFHQSHIKKRSQHLNISKSSPAHSRKALSLSVCLLVCHFHSDETLKSFFKLLSCS